MCRAFELECAVNLIEPPRRANIAKPTELLKQPTTIENTPTNLNYTRTGT